MIPDATSYNIKFYNNPEFESTLEKLRFVCTDANGFSEQRFEYYKNYLLMNNSNNAFVIGPDLEELTLSISNSSLKTICSGPINSPWPLSCHDVRHTSRSSYSTAGNLGIEKWRFSTDGKVDESPIIGSDGTLYFGGNYGGLPDYLFAVNPNGTEKWKFKTDYLILGSSPAIAEDDTIYIGSWDAKLYAINPDGTQKWRFGSGAQVFSSPVIAVDGTIYFGVMGPGDIGRIYAVNPNGTEKWHYDTGYWITSDPCIADDGTVYIGSYDNYLYALYPNGTLRWRFKTGDDIRGSVSIADDGTVYVGSYDKNLYAINPDGSEKWRCNLGYGIATNPSIASDGTIYVGGDKLYAVYPNGTLRWSNNLGGNRHIDHSSAAISADGTIYFGTNIGDVKGGEIIALNPDGTEKWRKNIAHDWVESSPTIAEDGTVYIGSSYDLDWDYGYLHAFGPQETNTPPENPVISGPQSGKAGTEYLYNFISVDPDNNPVSFYIDWGDGSTPSWSREYASGETAKIKHTWNEQGSYIISVKAKDTFDGESGWAYFDITMPRNKIISKDFFIQFLQSHPNLFPILKHIILN